MVIIIAPPDDRLEKMGLDRKDGKRIGSCYEFELTEEEFFKKVAENKLTIVEEELDEVKWFQLLQGQVCMADFYSSREARDKFNKDTQDWW